MGQQKGTYSALAFRPVMLIIQSMAIKNKKGESKQPCLTPVLTLNASVGCPLCMTLHDSPSYEDRIMFTIFTGTP